MAVLCEAAWAAWQNDLPTLAALLDAEPHIIRTGGNMQHNCNELPLHVACAAGSVEAAQLLLDRGADISERSLEGVTPLMCACHVGRPAVVSLLLSRGADPTVLDAKQRAFLTAAAIGSKMQHASLAGSDHVAVVRLLLEDGRVPVDAKDKRGRTALWYACYYADLAMTRLLVVVGHADYAIKDHFNRTAVDEAEKPSNPSVVQNPALSRFFKWYKGERRRAFLVSKARALVEATEIITRAPEMAKAKTGVEARKARAAAAPVYLRDRVQRRSALPLPDVTIMGQRSLFDPDEKAAAREAEMRAVLEYVVRRMNQDLFVEMMQGLRRDGWEGGGEEV